MDCFGENSVRLGHHRFQIIEKGSWCELNGLRENLTIRYSCTALDFSAISIFSELWCFSHSRKI